MADKEWIRGDQTHYPQSFSRQGRFHGGRALYTYELSFDSKGEPKRWVLCLLGGDLLPDEVRHQNPTLGPDQIAEAQAWADDIISDDFRRVHASRLI